ncbi:MAG: SHOCT domain-containing protein [Lachnospiraceae bacterium]|nr:SHOCT domain-containing protein [Lachnospiraceae bacterium]
MYAKVELTVTNKRIYGLAAFGKRVDLPLDSVAAVGTSAFKTISITSASGAIKFGMIRNFQEIHSEISKLLVERQAQKQTTTQTTIKQEIPQSNADELKKYKDLLDNGVITQEEFDAKKKQLLGL